MEPAFYRGDLLFLMNPVHEKYHTGDITVYKVPGAEIPIVHRVLETHEYVSGHLLPRKSFFFGLTKLVFFSRFQGAVETGIADKGR